MGSYREITDSMAGAKNLIEAAGIRAGETVVLLAGRRSDATAAEAISAALELHGAHPHLLITESVACYGEEVAASSMPLALSLAAFLVACSVLACENP